MRNKLNLNQIVDQLFDFMELLLISKAQPYISFHPEIRMSQANYFYKLRKFKKHGLIKKVKKNQKYVYEITDKARQIKRGAVTKIDRKDGQSTIILFDIPETKHAARNAFRRYLLKCGYTQIQKSVFIGPFEITHELSQLIGELEIKNNVTFIAGRIEIH